GSDDDAHAVGDRTRPRPVRPDIVVGDGVVARVAVGDQYSGNRVPGDHVDGHTRDADRVQVRRTADQDSALTVPEGHICGTDANVAVEHGVEGRVPTANAHAVLRVPGDDVDVEVATHPIVARGDDGDA